MSIPDAFTPRHVAWILGLAYAALLAAGMYAVVDRRTDAEAARLHAWRAARDLPEHAQLDTTDLAPPPGVSRERLPRLSGLTGRHLAVSKQRGEPVTAADLRTLPRVGTPAPGWTDFVVALRADEVPAFRMLDPEQEVTGCVGAPGDEVAWTCLPPFRVVAVHLPTAPGDSAWAMLRTAGNTDAYAFPRAQTRMVVRTTPRAATAPSRVR